MTDSVEFTNLDQPLFEGADATKRDLVEYLEAMSELMVPVLRDRPLSVIRVLRGQAPFMQKNVPKYTPDWIPTVEMWAERSKREVSYALCNERRTLLWFGNQRAVEYHPTLFRVPEWDRPTHLVLDIDPPEGDAFQLADRVYKRDQDLLAHKAIAQADLETAESARAQAEADLQSSEQALRVLGITDPEKLANSAPSAEVPLLAPLAGEIVERLCSPGQLLQAGASQCFTLSDMSTVWVLVNIYQNDVAEVRVGDEVSINNESYSGVVRGKIAYIAPSLDPATRTVQARIESNNPGERLKKDMYVTALLRAGVIRDALVVPDTAVLRDSENMPYVYLQTGSNQFARRMVSIGQSQDGKTQIQAGLQAGDKIVGDGSLFLQFQNSMQR